MGRSVVLGSIEVKERTLVLNVNSAARAERARAMLEGTLGGLFGAPLTKIQTVEQMRAARRDGRSSVASEGWACMRLQKEVDKQARDPLAIMADAAIARGLA